MSCTLSRFAGQGRRVQINVQEAAFATFVFDIRRPPLIEDGTIESKSNTIWNGEFGYRLPNESQPHIGRTQYRRRQRPN